MLERVTGLFTAGRLPWDETDLKHALQAWLRKRTASDQILCLSVAKAAVVIRVGTPALYQEVRLLEYDIRQWLEKEYQYEFKRLQITER